ncbi:MAG: CoA transferase [Myxococcota bacterium]
MMAKADDQPVGGGLMQGVRVLEVGAPIAVPLVGMMLAEQGADVVRVVRSADRPQDPVLDAMLARGKEEVVLDLDEPADARELRSLVKRADVVLDAWHPMYWSVAGVDAAELVAEHNAHLIHCRVTGFPPWDPRSELPDYEQVAGMAAFLYDKPLGKPRYHEFAVGSVIAGLYAANAVVAALIARERTGRGQEVGVSLYESDLFAQILQILVKTGVPRGFLPLKMVGTPFMSPWQCSDGRYIYLHITLPSHNAQILDVLEGLGYESDVRHIRSIMSDDTRRDPSQVKSIPEAKRIREAYERVFSTKPADEWEKLLGGELCCIKVRTIGEWMQDSRESGMTDVCEVRDPEFGGLTALGPAVTSPERPPVLVGRRAGQGSAVLDRWEGAWQADKEELGRKVEQAVSLEHPLEGIRVLDLSRVIAGPCAARVLAELGADVVSLQSPTNLDWALSFHLVFNPGKRSATLDFRDDAGKQKLWKLMEAFGPDALIQNYRHLDVAKAVGIDPEAVRGKFPNIVYTHLNAYGNEGGWRDRPGFEQVVQAVTGVQMAYAGGGRPRLLPSPIIDIGCGLAGALSTLMGLYHRARTGEGSFGTTHLTSIAVYFQARSVASLQRSARLQNALEAGHRVAFDPGRLVVASIVRTLDGHALVAGPRHDVERWAQRAGIIRYGKKPDGELLGEIGSKMWRRTASQWQRSVSKAGLAHRVVVLPGESMRSLVRDIVKYDPGPYPPVRKRVFPGVPEPLTFVRSPMHLSDTPVVDVAPPPERGGDTSEMMKLIGEDVPEGAGVVPYPKNKPLALWLASFARWGYFAWRSGNI